MRRDRGCGSALTLAEMVDEYLAQHDGEPETIAKLRWLLTKPVKAFGHRRLPQLHSQEPRRGGSWPSSSEGWVYGVPEAAEKAAQAATIRI